MNDKLTPETLRNEINYAEMHDARLANERVAVYADAWEAERTALLRAVVQYVMSEGCNCCEDLDHPEHESALAKLLGIREYDDGSGCVSARSNFDWEAAYKREFGGGD